MGSVGDAYDNAMAESFFATLECELLARERFETPVAAEPEVFAWIEGWYNSQRRHSSIGYVSPNEFERRHAQGASRPQPEPRSSILDKPRALLSRDAGAGGGGSAPASPGRGKETGEEQEACSLRDVPESAELSTELR
ncbi:MAG: transposase [Deltaproteobacteria bacterium]|nr:transposase [Deltaproteobacteria bacterium]